jgi:predicted DNA-binding transcriptional regulator YafY
MSSPAGTQTPSALSSSTGETLPTFGWPDAPEAVTGVARKRQAPRPPARSGPTGRQDERRHVTPERLRRIWGLVEDIAHNPGKSRLTIAAELALGERQVQSDLNVIRHDLGLPLVRRHGYRFLAPAGKAAPAFTLAEAQLLVLLLRRASRDPSFAGGASLHSLLAKLPALFPPHLQPLLARTLQAAGSPARTIQQEIFTTIADALSSQQDVKLHYPVGAPESTVQEPIVHPDILVPYKDSWHLIGTCRQNGRIMAFNLESVVAVTPAGRF